MSNKETSNLKWCFLVSPSPLLMEFFGKFAEQIHREGDDYILVVNSKIAEYSKLQYFPQDSKMYSKVDWCRENYKEKQREFEDFSWKAIFPDYDRSKFFPHDYEHIVEIISQLYQFVDSVFQKERPNVVLYEQPGSLMSQVVYSLCKKYNIKYLGLVISRFSGRTDIRDVKYISSQYEKDFDELKDKNISDVDKTFAQDLVRQLVSHQQVPSYVDYHFSYAKRGMLKNYFRKTKEMLPHWITYILKRKSFASFDYNSELELQNYFRSPWRSIKRKVKKKLLSKHTFDSVVDSDQFFLYPLHVQPEISTSALATYFTDQLNTITNIAFALPFPYKLYVKEHPLSAGTRPGDYYKKIKRNPQVVLLSPNENIESVIKKSQGVIVLAGTVGLEAALVGKPVYVLGDAFYTHHPSCRKIDSFEELKQKIKEDLERKPALDDLENINIRFILSYFRNTLDMNVYKVKDTHDSNNYQSIYHEMKEKFFL